MVIWLAKQDADERLFTAHVIHFRGSKGVCDDIRHFIPSSAEFLRDAAVWGHFIYEACEERYSTMNMPQRNNPLKLPDLKIAVVNQMACEVIFPRTRHTFVTPAYTTEHTLVTFF